MDENARKKIRNRISMRFRRRAEALGRPKEWKCIEINGKTFEQALDEALRDFEEGKTPLSEEEAIEEFKKGILGDEDEKTREHEKNEGEPYTLNPSVLRMWSRPSEEQREAEIKKIADSFNEGVEEELKNTICPRCHSSVCKCGK